MHIYVTYARSRKILAKWLVNPRADLATVAVQADATAFEQVCNGCNGFAVIPRDAADSEDQVAEARADAWGFL